ncbi:MAG: hypothetical protein FWF43_03250 [Propionibacteriaceae bacterium]|nr:hypothetical protein [Propionibacteriaceae bacterium]
MIGAGRETGSGGVTTGGTGRETGRRSRTGGAAGAVWDDDADDVPGTGRPVRGRGVVAGVTGGVATGSLSAGGSAAPVGAAPGAAAPVAAARLIARSRLRAAIRSSVLVAALVARLRIELGRVGADGVGAGAGGGAGAGVGAGAGAGLSVARPSWKKRERDVSAGSAAGSLAGSASAAAAAELAARLRLNSAILLGVSDVVLDERDEVPVRGERGDVDSATSGSTIGGSGGGGGGGGDSGGGASCPDSWASWSRKSVKLFRPVMIFSSNGSGGCRSSSSSPKIAAKSASAGVPEPDVDFLDLGTRSPAGAPSLGLFL